MFANHLTAKLRLMRMIVELVKEFTFEAAHRLPRVPAEHKCARLHGHSFKCEVTVRGEVDPKSGWFIDYAQITDAFEPLRQRLDHYYLNEIDGLENATSENLARWIWERLEGTLPGLHRITIRETCTARCDYYGDL
jgi:6-pyruvoyltetrahydropterin/6-carboxytetrahydropterin synthase